jgi:hemerythrin-like domain-containing protein
MTTPKKKPSHDVVAALIVEHRHMARLLDALDQQLSAASRGGRIDREAVRSVMHYLTEHPDAYHHPREDAMFARLERRDPGLRKRIVAIQRAHRTLAAAGKKLLAAAEREPGHAGNESDLAARIGAYASAQREHMAIEERDLFPRARQLLDGDDLAAIDRDFRRVTDPIFEASVRDAYAAYPAVVRMLVEQPAFRQALDLVESGYEAAAAFGELLLSAPAAPTPAPRGPARKRGASESSPTHT